MSTNDKEKKPESAQNGEKKPEEKDWRDHINDFIKNPLVTAGLGAVGGYLLGVHNTRKEIEEIKAEHKKQLEERDKQMNLFMQRLQQQLAPLTGSAGELPEGENLNFLKMEQDPKDNKYKYRSKSRHFKI